jgi:hypothetical protein
MATGLMLRNSDSLKQQMPNLVNTIRQGPSHRPLGRGACYDFEKQPEAKTPGIAKQPFKGSAGFYVGRYSAENPFNPVKRAPGVFPLSNPDLASQQGNLGDAYPVHQPIWDTPISAAWEAAKASMAGIPQQEPQPARGMAAEFHRSQGFGVSMPAELKSTFDDFALAQASAKKDAAIRTAIKNGFSMAEAEAAYKAIRAEEAKAQMFQDRDPNNRLNDILDSKFGGVQDGAVRSNDESALFLATRGGLKNFTMGKPQPLGGDSRGYAPAKMTRKAPLSPRSPGNPRPLVG